MRNRYPKPNPKNDTIQVPVTKEDRDLIQQKALEKGVTVAAYVRSMLFNRPIELSA